MQSLLTFAMLLQLQAPAPATTTSEPAPSPPPAAPAEAAAPTATPPAEAPAKSLLPPKTQPRLLVMDIADKGAGPEITNAVNQAIQGQAVASHTGEAITATQIKLLLDAQATQQLVGCDAEACMTTIGTLVEADVILGGNVAKVGEDIVITVLTVDPTSGKRLKQEQRKTPLSRDLYYYAAKQLASLVLTGKAADPRVPVIVNVMDKGTAVEGTIIVDGQERGAASTLQLELDPGQHDVVVKRSGFADWRSVIDVQEGTPLQVTSNLVGERIYLWPVAIATGVAAVATGVTWAIMYDLAAQEATGQGLFGAAKDPGNSYEQVQKTDTIDLCQREQNIWVLSGRTPNDGEALFAANSCGTLSGPGVGAGIGIASATLFGATAILVGTDLVLGAVASE